MKYAKLFLALRKELKLNQYQMAKKLYTSQGAISKIEAGSSKPCADTFARVVALVTKVGTDSEKILDSILFP